MGERTIQLLTEGFPERGAFDTAVSRALLLRVAEGEPQESLRLYRPGPVVSFGPQDVRAPGFERALHAAHASGFGAVLRLGGGRAAVFHEDTLAFAWTSPDAEARAHIQERYRETADIIRAALTSLGVDARIGEVPGEYCPGAYSVNAHGRTKLMGVGQRVAGKAAHVGGVVVVDGADRARDVLVPVYEALGLDWDPSTTGSVVEEAPGVTYEKVAQAIRDQFATRYTIVEGELSDSVLRLAERVLPEHELG